MVKITLSPALVTSNGVARIPVTASIKYDCEGGFYLRLIDDKIF